jgi:peptidoglycan/LPS O-acetylase OafA/YrhL
LIQADPIAPSVPRHYGQLDALRAFAVLGVLVSHWIPNHLLPVGIWGVRLFFVLSGFLITGILLQARDDAEAVGIPSGRVLAAFYARRFLRIFPLYYATLALAAVVNPANRPNIFWFATYTQNVLFAIDGESRQMSHFWSLAVEEQFYLVWPWIVLFVPRRRLRAIIIIAVILGPVSKTVALWWFGMSPYAAAVLPTSSFDTLGTGGLLAFVLHNGRDRPEYVRGWVRVALWFGAGLLIAAALLGWTGVTKGIWDVFDDLASSVAFAGLVGAATFGFTGRVGRLLELRPLREIGKVSYGIYVLHMFAPGQVAKVAGWIRLDPSLVASPWIWLGTTLIASFASWHLFELPINNLKRHFPYTSTTVRGHRNQCRAEGQANIREPDSMISKAVV